MESGSTSQRWFMLSLTFGISVWHVFLGFPMGIWFPLTVQTHDKGI